MLPGRQRHNAHIPTSLSLDSSTSVHAHGRQVPSAPPLHVDLETVLEGEGDLLSLEPPTWVPDSHAGECCACHEMFRCG